MLYECRITVLETKCFPELQKQYLADPKSGPYPFFKPGDTFLLKRTPQQDDFYRLMNGRFCGENHEHPVPARAAVRDKKSGRKDESLNLGFVSFGRVSALLCAGTSFLRRRPEIKRL